MLVGKIPGRQLNCVDNEGVVGSGEEIVRQINALLALNDEVKLQRQLLEFRESFVGRKDRAGLKRFMIGEEDELLSS